MTGIELYSTTAANNNSAVPNGWPEGMAPSGVNDAARQMMASIRTWYETAEWINLGHTPTYIGATQFSVPTDLTTTYQVGRRVKAVGSTPFTIYGTISVSAYVSVTTVTVVWDSGSLDGTLTAVSVGAASVTNPSIASAAVKGYVAVPFTAASAAGAASFALAEDTDNGTNVTTFQGAASLASDITVTLPAVTGTLATLAGTETFTNKTATDIVLNGTLTGTAIKDEDTMVSDSSSAVPTQQSVKAYVDTYKLVSGTAQATTSGTSFDFTGIPSGVKRIQIALNSVSTNGTSSFLFQIGDSGGIETSSYASGSGKAGTSAFEVSSTAGFVLGRQNASDTHSGIMTLINVSGNIWVASHAARDSINGYPYSGGGDKTLSATLDRVRLTTVSGDTFDAGSVNIVYES